MSNERYTIIVSGEKLVFTKDQIESDPGNYFATYFFGDFAEGAEGVREIVIEKDAQLFKLIQAHLRGYQIIPLADTAIPWYMTREGTLANLLLEAQFYALDMLAAKIKHSQDEEASKKALKGLTERDRYILATGRNDDGWMLEGLHRALRNSPETGYTAQVAWLDYLADEMPGYKKNAFAHSSKPIVMFSLSLRVARQLMAGEYCRDAAPVPCRIMSNEHLRFCEKALIMIQCVANAASTCQALLQTLPTTMSNEIYTIIVSGEKLVFSKDQILSDPGNYFATYFFGDFAEGAQGTRELLVQKDVQLFRLIQAHLRGYEILPLADAAIPSYMTKEVALANLLREAEFYALDVFAEKIRVYQSNEDDEVSSETTSQPGDYKLAHRLGRGKAWSLREIPEEIYRFHLTRISNVQSIVLLPSIQKGERGYTMQVAWAQFTGDGNSDTEYALFTRDY